MTDDEIEYERAVRRWRAGLSALECRDLHGDYMAGDRDPAAVDGHAEFLARRGFVTVVRHGADGFDEGCRCGTCRKGVALRTRMRGQATAALPRPRTAPNDGGLVSPGAGTVDGGSEAGAA